MLGTRKLSDQTSWLEEDQEKTSDFIFADTSLRYVKP